MRKYFSWTQFSESSFGTSRIDVPSFSDAIGVHFTSRIFFMNNHGSSSGRNIAPKNGEKLCIQVEIFLYIHVSENTSRHARCETTLYVEKSLFLCFSGLQTDPDCRKIQPRAPKLWKRTRPFKEKFVSGFQRKDRISLKITILINCTQLRYFMVTAVAPSRRSCEYAKDPLYLYESFCDHSRIGQGSFGMVYRVICKETGEPSAVKVSKVNGLYTWFVKDHSHLPVFSNTLRWWHWRINLIIVIGEVPSKESYSTRKSVDTIILSSCTMPGSRMMRCTFKWNCAGKVCCTSYSKMFVEKNSIPGTYWPIYYKYEKIYRNAIPVLNYIGST